MKTKLPMTPLQRVVGFDVAEETYDLLPELSQVILDLKIEGWNDSDIARVLGMPRVTVIDMFRRARHFLANSKMKMILEARIYYRETHSTVVDDPEVDGTYEFDDQGDRSNDHAKYKSKNWNG